MLHEVSSALNLAKADRAEIEIAVAAEVRRHAQKDVERRAKQAKDRLRIAAIKVVKPVATPDAGVQPQADGYTLREFAKRVGIPWTTLRKQLKRHLISPAVPGRKGMPDLFSPVQVTEYLGVLQRASRSSDGKFLSDAPRRKREGKLASFIETKEDIYSGLEAQKAYREFRKGMSDVDVVIAHGLHPGVVVELRRMWIKQGGGLLVSKHTLDRIAFMALDGPVPAPGEPWTEKALYEVFRLAAVKPACKTCQRETPEMCGGCVARTLAQADEASSALPPLPSSSPGTPPLQPQETDTSPTA